MIRVGIFGYGNLGKGVEAAIAKNPDMELTVTVEYPEQNSQVSRIIHRLKSEEQFLFLLSILRRNAVY